MSTKILVEISYFIFLQSEDIEQHVTVPSVCTFQITRSLITMFFHNYKQNKTKKILHIFVDIAK